MIAGERGGSSGTWPSFRRRILVNKSCDRQKILQCLKEISGIKRRIILEDSLELDLGIDSLGRIELTSALESAFSADLKVEAISRAFSVKALFWE